MKRFILYAGLLLLLFCAGCNKEYNLGFIEYEPKICVEGWIESDMPPMVILTRTASFNYEMDTATLLNHVIREAKVSVSDGTQTEILRLEVDNRYMPPYVYKGNRLRGESGKTYTLTIEYRGAVINAESYIPQPVPLESFTFVKQHPADTTGYIHVRFRNTVEEGAAYQLSTLIEGEETIYTPCLFGNMDRQLFPIDSLVSIQLNRGPKLYPETHFETSFTEGNSIRLKFSTFPQHGYDFWNSWQNEVLNTQNPIFPAHTDLESNIRGGIGIWCGYGTYTYRIDTNLRK